MKYDLENMSDIVIHPNGEVLRCRIGIKNIEVKVMPNGYIFIQFPNGWQPKKGS